MFILRHDINDTFATLVAGGSWVLAQVAQTADVIPPEWLGPIEKSILATLVLFFVYTSWKREERMSKRIDELENRQETRMSAMLERYAKAMDVNSDAVTAMQIAVNESIQVMQKCKLEG